MQAILPQVEQLDIDLPEIQKLDDKEIIKVKLLDALKYQFLVGIQFFTRRLVIGYDKTFVELRAEEKK